MPIHYIIYKGDGPKRSRAAGPISKAGARGYTIAEGVQVSVMAVMRGGRKMGAAIGAQPIRSMSHPFETSPQVSFETTLRAPFETSPQVSFESNHSI